MVVDELALLLPGAGVERVLESKSSGNSILLELHSGRSKRLLLFSPDRTLPRFHLLSHKLQATPLSHAFPLFLKSRITGARVAGIRLLNEDRVVEILFRRRDTQYHLLFELIGRAANLVLTDATGVILAVYYPIPVSGRNARVLLPGLRYETPPKRVQPQKADSPVFIPAGETELAANRAVEIEFEKVLSEMRFTAAASRLGTVLRKALERTLRRRDSLLQDMSRSDQASEHKQAGDLILANLDLLKPGMSKAELTGHDGIVRLVPLDQRRTPVRNAEQYFKRYKKAKAGRSIVSGRLQEAEDELAFLTDLQSRLECSSGESDLADIESWLEKKGFLKSLLPVHSSSVKKQASASLPVRKIQFRGWDIIVGKNAAGNDYISTKLARPSDLWFHAEGIPGSHVLVRNPERREVPADVVARAASLAAYYSKGRSAGKVPVTFTLSRNIRKPKGAKAGLVTLSERTTIMAVPSED